MGYDDEGAVLTARALDDPTRPFPDIRPLADLSTVQVIGGALCLAVGALVWWIGRRFGDAGQYAGLAVGLGGAVGIVWVTRGRREPVAAQLVAFARRRHNYCPAQDVRATRRDHRLALAMMRQYTRRGDLAGWGQYVATLLAAAWSMRPALHGLTGQPAPASSLLGGATFGEGGVAVVGGRAVAVVWVEPLILSARSPGERARLAAGWAGLADLLEPGQRLAYIADNKSADGAAVMRAIEERQQPSHNNLAAYVARRNRRWARELADSYSPAVEHYIVVDAPAGAAGDAVTHAREAVEGRLSHLGIAHRRLAAPELRGLVRAGCHLTVDARALRPGRGVVAVPRDDEERMADVAVHEHPTALHVGDRWVGSVYALRLPPKTRIDWMRSLVTLPFRTRLLVEMEGRDGLKERAALDRKITSGGLIQSSKVANQGTRDTRMSAAEEEYAALIPRLDGGMTAIVRASLIVTTDAPTRAALDMQLARVRAALRAAGCQVAGGRGDQLLLWQRSCLPLLLSPRPAGPDHRYRVTSESAGHLFTPQSNTPGHPSGALIGRTRHGRELVHYDWRVPATGVVLLAGVQGCQPAGSKVLLADGTWTTVERVRVGDMVLSPQPDGTTVPARVMRIASFEDQPIYRVQTNGERTPRGYLCSGDHILPMLSDYGPAGTSHRRDMRRMLRHYELIVNDYLRQGPSFKSRARIFTTPAYDLPAQEYEIDPYTMGCMIGDGCVTGTNPSPSFTTATPELIDRMVATGASFGRAVAKAGTPTCMYNAVREFRMAIRRSEIWGRSSYTHRIPDAYMQGSLAQRLQLLAGLIDTDGETAAFTSMSRGLAEDVAHLIFSIGGKASVKEHMTRCNGKPFMSYRVHYSTGDHPIPVTLAYKAQEPRDVGWKDHRNHTFTVNPAGAATVYGFTLDSPSQWYVTDDWLVTHNSGKSMLAQLLAMDTLCEDNWITAVDPSGSWASLCRFVDGTYLRLASPDLPLSVWTLARATYQGDHAATVTALVKAHRAMLSGGDATRALTPFEGGLLHRGVAAVLHTAIPCERELVAWLGREIAEASHRRGEIEDMVSKLGPFVGDGAYAHLADVVHSTDREGIAAVADLDARMVVLDTAGLEAEGALLAYTVIELVTTLRAFRARERGLRARLFIDEGWNALRYALDWLSVRVARTARHLDQDAVLSTQNVSDVLRDPAAATILTAIPTVFLFRCVDEGATAAEGIGRFRRLFGLTDEAIDALAGLPMPGDGQPSEALMVMRSRRHTTTQAAVVQIAPPAELLALAGSYAAEKDALRVAVEAAGGDMLAGAFALADRERVPS